MITISISNGRALIWDIADVQKLRVDHHITGVLSGTLPQVGQQNVFLGLPLILIPEEVVLLVKNGFAILLDDVAAHEPATLEQMKEFNEERDSNFHQQQLSIFEFEQSKKLVMNEKYKEVIDKKREERNKLKGKNVEILTELEILVDDLPPSLLEIPSVTTLSSSTPSKPPNLSKIPYQISIHASSTPLPWFKPTNNSIQYSTLTEAAKINLFNYPETKLQKVKCKIFEDLWKKGFFMGGGLKFGGDFLVYPGDPLRYHSHFTLTVLATPQTSIMPLDIVAYGRLATAVKKAHLLASWNQETEQAEYFSLEWAAFG